MKRLFLALALIAQTAPAAETATGPSNQDPRGVETISADKSGEALAKGAADCNRKYAEHNCAALRASLPEGERANVIDCSVPESYVPARIAIGVGHGVGAFVWDTAKGVVTLPYHLAVAAKSAPGAIANSFQEQAKCYDNIEYKKSLLEPLKAFKGQKPPVERWTCNQIRQYVEQAALRKDQEVSRKKIHGKEYEEFLKANPDKKDLAERRWPQAQRELNEEEKEFDQSAERRKRAQGLLPDVLKKLEQTHACYTNQHKAKLATQIIAGVVVPGTIAKLVLDPKARLLLTDLASNGRFTAATSREALGLVSPAARAAETLPKFKNLDEIANFIKTAPDEDLARLVRAHYPENSPIRRMVDEGDIKGARDFMTNGNTVTTLGQKIIAPEAGAVNRAMGLGPPAGEITRFNGMYKYVDEAGEQVGYLNVKAKGPGEIYVDTMGTSPQYAGRGVGDQMLKRMIDDNPGVSRYSAEMWFSNRDAVQRGLAAGMSCVEAVQQTPYYKSMKRLGFGTVVSATCNGAPTITVGR